MTESSVLGLQEFNHGRAVGVDMITKIGCE